MKIIFIAGGLFCLIIGSSALRGVIDTCWEGYVSPPLNLSDLFIGIFYTTFSFVPVILIMWRLDTKKWQKFIIGGTELIVITSSIYEFVKISSHGH
jgi:hypothetical protein